jgi:hypothetical protein
MKISKLIGEGCSFVVGGGRVDNCKIQQGKKYLLIIGIIYFCLGK